jgi:hypothetical protein
VFQLSPLFHLTLNPLATGFQGRGSEMSFQMLDDAGDLGNAGADDLVTAPSASVPTRQRLRGRLGSMRSRYRCIGYTSGMLGDSDHLQGNSLAQQLDGTEPLRAPGIQLGAADAARRIVPGFFHGPHFP